MSSNNSLKVKAGEVKSALKDVLKGRKSKIVTLRFVTARGGLSFLDAAHEVIEVTVSAAGFWRESLQIDGRKLAKICDAFASDDLVNLSIENTSLRVTFGTFKLSIGRHDVSKKTQIMPAPLPVQKHIGPLEIIPSKYGDPKFLQHSREDGSWEKIMQEVKKPK